MGVGEEKSAPLRSSIQIVVEGWGFQPTPSKALAGHLDRLVRLGIRRVVSIVPWQGIESDVSHRLSRFLQLAHSRKLGVSLVVSPELGLNFPFSGVPSELALKPQNQARHSGGRPAIIGLAPKSFALPSLSAGECVRRYASFISRLESILKDLSRTQPDVVASVRLITTGSFWKYYRDPREACQSPFAGTAGDVSEAGLGSYSRKLDDFYGSIEFASESGASTARWRSQALEELNRRWFFQASEDAYRHATATLLRKRFGPLSVPVEEAEVLTPEADPALAYSQFLCSATGAASDARPYCRLIEEFAWRRSQGDLAVAPPVLHWSDLGSFEKLSTAERSYLLMKSLLIAGARGGETWISGEAWLGMSAGLRHRLSVLSEAVASGELKLVARAVTWVPHQWSGSGRLWSEISQLSSEVGIISAAPLDQVLKDAALGLVMVDPARIIRKLEMRALLEAASSGRIVVLPKSPLWSQEAKRELEAGLSRGQLEDIAELAPFCAAVPTATVRIGQGWLIVHELPQEMSAEARSDWRNLAEGLLRFAGLNCVAQASHPRIKIIPLRRRGGGLGLFLLNESAKEVSTELSFANEVELSDLTESLGNRSRHSGTGEKAKAFKLTVPAWGILPLAVETPIWDFVQGGATDREEAVLASRLPVPGEEEFTWNV